MVEKKQVSVNWQSLFVIIPILDLWATYRIKKLRLYLLITIVFVVTELIIESSIFGVDSYFMEQKDLSGQSGLQAAFILIEIGISIILVRKWSREWNEKISRSPTEIEENSPPQTPLSILKERYAKGEISKEEFDKMKEDLS